MAISKIEAIKKFFDSPERPVTNAEIMKLAKEDREGYREIAKACAIALGETLETT